MKLVYQGPDDHVGEYGRGLFLAHLRSAGCVESGGKIVLWRSIVDSIFCTTISSSFHKTGIKGTEVVQDDKKVHEVNRT